MPLTNAEKCRRRGQKLAAEDPEGYERERQLDRERSRLNRKKPKTEEELQQKLWLGVPKALQVSNLPNVFVIICVIVIHSY